MRDIHEYPMRMTHTGAHPSTPRKGVLPDRERARGQRDAILASCFGAVSQVMVRDSSIIILFAALIGAGEMASIATTAMLPLAEFFLTIPFALLGMRLGKKRLILIASAAGCVLLLGTAAAPWAGEYAQVVLIASLVGYAVTISAYLSVWLALLDNILLPGERGMFFGRMRFTWQLIAILFVIVTGAVVGRTASSATMQIVIAVAALGLLGRFWFINDISESDDQPTRMSFRGIVRNIMENRKLTGFAVYLFCLYAIVNATIPVVFLYVKNGLMLPDNVVIIISAFSMAGLVIGFFFAGRIVHRYGVKPVFLTAHFGFGALNLLLLFVRSNDPVSLTVLIVIITCYGSLFACASVAVSSEILALASARNKTMSIAFCWSLYAGGLGASRLIASLIINSGMLAATWQCGSCVFTKYHSLFLVYGIAAIAISILLVLVPALTRRAETLPHV